MSRVSIYENGWINLVFDGKNKEYGAYQLRKQSDKTMITAFFSGIVIRHRRVVNRFVKPKKYGHDAS